MKFDQLIEGKHANEYTADSVKLYIAQEYIKRHTPAHNPWTHPQNYDPLVPPDGWRYDPYYEIWIKL
jgi:hypothetical protein